VVGGVKARMRGLRDLWRGPPRMDREGPAAGAVCHASPPARRASYQLLGRVV